MHIELTDHLRCPREHPEAFLVLLPDRMEQRQVVAGHLGCPICGWNSAWTDSVPDFGGGWHAVGSPPFDAAAAYALLGIEGPGGWVALAGNAGAWAAELAGSIPGLEVVAINPPAWVTPSATISVILSGQWPLKAHSMRGVILGTDTETWRDAGMVTTLPGLRTVGCGQPPQGSNVHLLGNADGVWVATHR